MHVERSAALDLLGQEGRRFRIPLYQRVYSWTLGQCKELWADLMRAADTEEEHFLGTVLCQDDEGAKALRTVDLVDGQQRLVTLTLLLAALSDIAKETSTAEVRALGADVDARFLFVRKGRDALPKLMLSCADAPTFEALLNATALPEDDVRSVNIVENHRFFKEHLAAPRALERAWSGLGRLSVISAQLDEDDEPQSVFESLNAKGKGLTSVDLIRNLLLARFDIEDQKRLFDELWQPLEELFQGREDAPDVLMDAALHAWLDARTESLAIQDRAELYGAFKRYVMEHSDMPLESLLLDINGLCSAFAEHLDAPQNRLHINWAKGRLTGLVSERKLFGD